MPALSLVRLSHIAPYLATLSRLGIPSEPLVRRAGLPVYGLGDAEVFAASHLIYDFVDSVGDTVDVDSLSWRVARDSRVEDLGSVGSGFVRGSGINCLHEALTHTARMFEKDSSRSTTWLEPRGDFVWFCYVGSHGVGTPGFEPIERYMVGIMTQMVQHAGGSHWQPLAIHLRGSEPFGSAASEELSGTTVHCHQPVTAIMIPRGLMARPVVPRERSASSRSDDQPHTYPPLARFAESLRQVLRPYITDGGVDLRQVASIARTSPRTLQRRLSEEGVSLTQLVDGLRGGCALDLVRTTDLPIREISEQLGYSDPAHLTRAFHRWTGMSPSQCRRLQAEQH